jgi:soluble lytic murein transglycosylase
MPRFLLAWLALTWPVFSAAQTPDAVRGEFASMLQAAELGATAADADSADLRSYLIYPYLQAARLRAQLKLAPAPPDEAIAAFLDTHGDAPWTRDLRKAWLGDLADRAIWPRFLAYYLEPRADASLRCHRLNAMIGSTPDIQLRESALAVWRTGAELPESCAAVFDWLRQQGVLTPGEIALRASLALENNKPAVAKMLLPQLPPERAAPLRQWIDLLEVPSRHLEAAVRAGAEPEVIAAGFARLAKQSTDAAAEMLPKLEAACGQPCSLRSPATIAELRRDLALNLSWSRKPETVAAFRQVDESALDERAQEWRVRAALWAGDWAQALQWLGAQPPALAAQPRWRYWRARALEASGRRDEARALYEVLTVENGYYPLMASERLGRGMTPVAVARPADPARRRQLATLPGLQRAAELVRVDRKNWAQTEWNEATAGLDPASLLEAARLASEWGWHLMAVGTASRADVYDDFALLYPRPFQDEVKKGARFAGVPPEWIYAVMRQESLYDPRARSSANALGLLQLLPTTAKAVAKRWSLPTPQGDALFDPATNITLGAAYLREQWERFSQHFILVLGAYNAGPNAVRRWLPPTAMEADVWIENIPYNETRSYIQRILWHSTVFGWEASGQAQRATRFLAPVTPLDVATALPGD